MRKLKLRKRDTAVSQPIVGKTFIYTDRGKLVPSDMLNNYLISKGQDTETTETHTQQLVFENTFKTNHDLLPRLYHPKDLLDLVDSVPILRRCIKTSAIDIGGLGWDLIPRVEDKTDNQEYDKAMEFLETPNDEQESLNDITEKLLTDWGSVGWYGLEVAKNNKDEIGKIFHVPASELWVHKTKKKYAQMRDRKITWFTRYQTGIPIDRFTGATSPITEEANALIFRGNYYALSPAYGAPDFIPATGASIGLIGIRDFNLAFFTNYGIPAYAVKLEGVWDTGSAGEIEEFLNTELNGADQQHKTFCIQVPTGGDLVFERLSIDTKEGSFKMFNEVWMQDVMISHAIPPYRLGIAAVGSLGGSTAKEMTEVYKQSTVTPAQNKLQHVISRMILKDGLKIKHYKLQFTALDTRDLDAEVERAVLLHSVGAWSSNDIRKELKLGKPRNDGDEYMVYATLGASNDLRYERNTRSAKRNSVASDSMIAKIIAGILENDDIQKALMQQNNQEETK